MNMGETVELEINTITIVMLEKYGSYCLKPRLLEHYSFSEVLCSDVS